MNAQIRSLFALCLLASAAHAHVITIADEAAYNQQIAASDKCCVVKFAADWCGVCKGVKQPFEELSDESEFKDVIFAHVNIDKAKDLTDKHGVGGVPTFIFVMNGKKVGEEVGVSDMKTFKDSMRNNIRSKFPKDGKTAVDSDSTPQDTPATEPDEQAQAAGIVQSIVKAVKLVIAVIVGLVQYTIDAIKGLFASH